MSKKSEKPKKGDLKVWWIPQVPMDDPFEVPVESVKQGLMISGILAAYDGYQFEHKIKPDYSNAGGIAKFDGEEWIDVDEDELP